MLASFYPPYPDRWVPGFDGSGIVADVAEDVTEFKRGDHVIVRPDRSSSQGVLAEYASVPRDKAVKAPKGLTHAESAVLATTARTAYQALFRPDIMSLKAGQSVLVDGASGGVGSFAVALAHASGAHVAGSCRATNAQYVRDLGAEAVFDYARSDFINAIGAWKPGGVDVVLDTQSGGSKTELLDVLAPNGLLTILATLNNDGDIAALSKAAESRGLRVHFLLLDYGTLREDIDNLAPLLAAGRVRMPDIAHYPLDRAGEALQAVKAGRFRGKIVVDIGNS